MTAILSQYNQQKHVARLKSVENECICQKYNVFSQKVSNSVINNK